MQDWYLEELGQLVFLYLARLARHGFVGLNLLGREDRFFSALCLAVKRMIHRQSRRSSDCTQYTELRHLRRTLPLFPFHRIRIPSRNLRLAW